MSAQTGPVFRGDVLIVDDEQAYCEATATILEASGYRVRIANGAREMYAHAADGRPEVLLLDIMMPEIDGLTILDELISSPEWLGTRIIVVSAKTQPEDRAAALGRGADAFLPKPFTAGELVEIVGRVLAPVGGPD